VHEKSNICKQKIKYSGYIKTDMNICLISPYPITDVGGIGSFVKDMSSYLEEKGINIRILTTFHHLDDIKKMPKSFEGKVIAIDNERVTRPFKTIYVSIKMSISIFKMRKQIDVLHFQTPKPQSALPCLFGRILKIPSVTTLHGIFPRIENTFIRMFYRFFERITLNSSDAVVAVSAETKEH
jgi:glycosyltransferase involved in cell wall biosynthesis